MAKKRKSDLKQAAARAKAAPQQRSNPFEELHNRKKFSILGKKTKGDKGKRLQSRQDATAKVHNLQGTHWALLALLRSTVTAQLQQAAGC